MMKQMKTANMVRRNLKWEQLADALYSSLFSCLYSGSVPRSWKLQVVTCLSLSVAEEILNLR